MTAPTTGPPAFVHSRPHHAPAAANTTPPASRLPLVRATTNPPSRPAAATTDGRVSVDTTFMGGSDLRHWASDVAAHATRNLVVRYRALSSGARDDKAR